MSLNRQAGCVNTIMAGVKTVIDQGRVTLEFKSATVSETGMLSGYANVTGNVDRAGEVVAKGAYSNLDDFVKDGFSAVGHDWMALPIGTISKAFEDDNGLYVEMQFHSTQDAQNARTIVKERLDRGKSVGLSIGYRVLEDEWQQTDGKTVRILKSLEVYEFSIVTVPANPQANTISAKGHSGMPLGEHVETVLDAVEDVVTRVEGLHDLRRSEGKAVGAESVTRVLELKARFDSLVHELTAEPVDMEAEYKRLAYQTLSARQVQI